MREGFGSFNPEMRFYRTVEQEIGAYIPGTVGMVGGFNGIFIVFGQLPCIIGQ